MTTTPVDRHRRPHAGDSAWTERGLLAVVCFLLYGWSVGFGYVNADDVDLVLRNQAFLADPSNAVETFRRSYFNVEGALAGERTYYRPIVILSLMGDARIGGTAPAVYHLTNVLLHAATVVLLAWVATLLGASRRAAFLSGLLFAVHPLNVTTVSWIVGRNDSLLAIFVLVSVAGLVAWVRQGRRVALGVHLVGVALALFTKESALALFPVLGLLTWLWLDRRRVYWERWPVMGAYAGILLTWAYLRQRTLGPGEPTDLVEVVGAAWTNAPALLVYVGKFVWPVGLSIMPGVTPGGVVAGVGAVLVLGVALVTSVGRARTLFVAAWTLLFLAPALLVPDLPAYEHRAYVPLLGVAIGLARLGTDGLSIGRGRAARAPFSALVLGVVVLFFAVSARQSRVFANPYVYWESATTGTPYAAVAHVNLGKLYEEDGALDLAERHYREALAIDPGIAKANNNLGIVMMKRGNPREGAAYFRRELRSHPGSAEARYNLGLHYLLSDRVAEAVSQWEQAIELDPYFLPAYEKLEERYLASGQVERAAALREQLRAIGQGRRE